MALAKLIKWVTGDESDDPQLIPPPRLSFIGPATFEPGILRVGKGEVHVARILCISDTHERHRRLQIPAPPSLPSSSSSSSSTASSSSSSSDADCPSYDILIHAGDIIHWNTKDAAGVLADFVDWLASLPVTHIVLTLGNHETYFHKAQVDPRRFFGDRLGDRVTVLLNNAATVIVRGRPVIFWGSPNTPYRGWMKSANAYSTGDLHTLLDTIPAQIDVLVTHCPPFWILDEARENARYGAASILRWHESKAAEERPKLHVFGHCHESYGFIRDDTTLFINAAMPFRRRGPHIIDLFSDHEDQEA